MTPNALRWGCFNRPPFAAGYWAPDREYRPNGFYVMGNVWIPHTNTTACQSTSRATDPKCAGCKHIEDGK